MPPKQVEELISEHFYKKDYEAKKTSYNNDYGVDVFAMKGKDKIAMKLKCMVTKQKKKSTNSNGIIIN